MLPQDLTCISKKNNHEIFLRTISSQIALWVFINVYIATLRTLKLDLIPSITRSNWHIVT